jgi:hypothetical protein
VRGFSNRPRVVHGEVTPVRGQKSLQHGKGEVRIKKAEGKALPPNERAQVAKFVVENDDSWIPKSFKEGMADAEAGRFVDLDTALTKPYSGDQ